MKKVYTIKITHLPISRNGLWYEGKAGREYEAELKPKTGSNVPVFQVTMGQFVYPEDCTIVSERLVEK